MKSVFKILTFTYPYFNLIILNTIFNFLSVVFSLFSISLVIPILGILFGTIDTSDSINTELSILNIKDYIYAYIKSLIQTNGKPRALGFVCILLSIGTLLKSATRYLALYFLAPVRNNVIRDIRLALHTKILHSPIKLIRTFKRGDIVSRMTNDLIEIEWSIMGVLEFFIKDPIHILIFFISLIYISPQLTLISLVFLPITAIIITKMSKTLKKTSLNSQNQLGNLISLIDEMISNLKIIKAFNGYKFINGRFSHDNENLKNLNNKILWRKDLASPMSEFLSTVVMVIIIWWGGKIVLDSSLQPDVFIGFLLIFSQILPPAKSLTTAFYSIQKGSGSVKRIFDILNQNTSTKTLEELKTFKKEIKFSNASFKYNNELSIQDINLVIPKNSSTAIVGESGSGKSTLVDLLLNFYNLESGSITIDNQNINQINKYNFRSLFGLVSQNTMLFNDTIANNIRIGKNNATEKEVEAAAKIANIDKVIEKLEEGYNTIIGDQGDNLSGGEKQRICIARAIVSDAPIIVLDEATSSLDAESEMYIQESLSFLKKTKTLIIITHKLSLIKEVDNILVIKDGKIEEEGHHDLLMSKCGTYQKLYEIETSKKNEKN
jgi:subfamily B ATP-binding cassette protein MsbA